MKLDQVVFPREDIGIYEAQKYSRLGVNAFKAAHGSHSL
jgi:hypothetical protein